MPFDACDKPKICSWALNLMLININRSPSTLQLRQFALSTLIMLTPILLVLIAATLLVALTATGAAPGISPVYETAIPGERRV